MKSRFSLIACTIVLILCVASQIALVSAAAAYQDEFSSTTLQSFWSFTGTGSYDLTANSDYLRLTAPNGAKLSTISGSNLNAPRILQSVTGNIVEAITCVNGTFSSANYRGGLVLWANNQNFIRLEKFGSTQALMYPIIGGVESSPVTVSTGGSSNTLYLKLQKTGSTVTCSYSTTGAAYTTIGTCTFSLSDPLQIGLFAINADSSSSNFSADFNYFYINPYSVLSVLPEYPVGIFGATAAIAGAYVFFKVKGKVKPVAF